VCDPKLSRAARRQILEASRCQSQLPQSDCRGQFAAHVNNSRAASEPSSLKTSHLFIIFFSLGLGHFGCRKMASNTCARRWRRRRRRPPRPKVPRELHACVCLIYLVGFLRPAVLARKSPAEPPALQPALYHHILCALYEAARWVFASDEATSTVSRLIIK
jgi:hypothetical protein